MGWFFSLAKDKAFLNNIGLAQLDLDAKKNVDAIAKFDLVSKEIKKKDVDETLLIAKAYIKSENPNYKAAIDGYFIYLATMLLGDEVLESITSDLGDSKDQEGIVVRGLYPDVFKITGSFIIKGMESQFRK